MTATIEWRADHAPIDYAAAVGDMERRALAIRAGEAAERIWLLEHPPIYTAGTSASADELIEARFPVHATGRGGRHTYHGPGQRVAYVQLDLTSRGRDVRRYVAGLEDWVVGALGELGVAAHTVPGRVGIWTRAGGAEAKIGAIGVRVSRWVTLHGVAINRDPDLSHFAGIVPCGLTLPVTSLAALGLSVTTERLDEVLHARLPRFLTGLSVEAERRATRSP